MEVNRPIAAPSCDRHPFNGDSDFYPVAEQLLREHKIHLVIETGTYHGATTQWFARRVKRVITIEANRETFDKTSKQLASLSNVSCLLGDSADLLTTILPALDKVPVLFYLDAHWGESWPIHKELATIAPSFANNCIIVIDDFQIPDRPEFACDWYKDEALSLPHVRAGVEAALPNGHFQLYVPKQPPHRGRFIGRPAAWQSELPSCQVAQEGAAVRKLGPTLDAPAAHSVSYLELNGNASREALEDPRKFATFRQDPRIVQMMEHVSMQYARAYWEGVVRDFASALSSFDWKSLAQLDAVGGPRRYDFSALLKPHAALENYHFSTNFFRYLYTGLCLLRYAAEGTAKTLRIVEIGGGYGGQCKALFALAPLFELEINSYTLIDLEPAVALQVRFLQEAGVPVECLIAHSYEQLCDLHFAELRLGYDLGFSNYCFSELDRSVQDTYAQHVLPRCKQLYVIHNSPKVHPFVDTARFERSAEQPRTGPHNVVLTSKHPLAVHLHDANFAHLTWTSIPVATAQGTQVLEYSRTCGPDVAVFTERCLEHAEKCSAARKIAWLCEPRGIIAKERYHWVEQHSSLFDEIWTHEQALVERIPQARWVVHASTWIAAKERQLYLKTKDISFIASSKNWTKGHRLRQSVRAQLPPSVDRFGGPDGRVESKVTALAPYRFSIVIENVQVETFVTEKLVDCFRTGTVPVYWGPRRIERWFDCDGVLFFDTTEELLQLLPTLTADRYAAMRPAVARNFELAQTFLGAASPQKRVQMEVCGGLGNQLFQIATAVQYAERHSAEVVFSSALSTGQRKHNYARLFALSCAELAAGPSYKEPRFGYDPLPTMEQQLTLKGYFQSDRYVAGCKSFIHKCLEPWLASATAYRSQFGRCAAIHIRRGDYLGLADVHPHLPIEYYTALLEQFPKEQTLVFSDDIAWCKTAFPDYHCVEASHECEELLIMSQCELIIAANSTFSWWAGYLSAPGTRVVLPKRWFGAKGPPQWESIYYASMPVEAETETTLLFRQLRDRKQINSYYINLARRVDRRVQIEAELVRAQLDAKRYEAIERSPGSVGCALSHVACIRDAIANDCDYALIIEDDFEFLVDAKTFHTTLATILERYAGLEVVMLAYNDYKSLAQDELVRQAINVQTTAAYVVSRNAMPKVIEVFERSAQALEQGLPATQWAIDMSWKKLQGEGKRFYISTKRLGKQRVSYSDIMGRVVDYRC